MDKLKFDIPALVPISYCLEFLGFVPDQTMRRNVAYNLQYLDFLHELYGKYDINKSVEKSFLKNQIVILGSILECFVFSFLTVRSGSLDFGERWKEDKTTKRLISINDRQRTKTVLENLNVGKLSPRSDLAWMIEIAEKNNLFGKKFASTAHFVREHRNKIHLTTMTDLEYDYFTPKKLKEAGDCVYKFLVHSSGKTITEIKTAFHFLPG
jgi:hypothetical protein